MIQTKEQIFGADCCGKTTFVKHTEQETKQKALQRTFSYRNELADAGYFDKRTVANALQQKAVSSIQLCVIVLNVTELNCELRFIYAA